MYREADARHYARLAVTEGINIQKGQAMLLRVDVDCAEFGRMLMEEAYLAGAGDVVLIYRDQMATRLRYEHTSPEILESPNDWLVRMQTEYLEKGGCVVSVVSEDPDCFLGLDMQKVGRAVNASKKVGYPFHMQIEKGENQWLVIGAPSVGWAKKAFPNEAPEKAVEKLWDAIYHTMRIDLPDPEAAWQKHSATLRENCRKLNESGVTTLKIKNSLGTDLTVGLVENAVWEGGASTTLSGVSYQANMPTEEVFTAPHSHRVDGTVYSSMPLNYQGMLIEGMHFTFKDGLVVDCGAEKGSDALELMLSADEGCRRLGEVALVPYGSLIQETGLLFFNTLYDENASCHLALGSAYANCSAGAVGLSRQEQSARGLNDSVSHVDFMFGTADLSVTGLRPDGTAVEIFRDGQWAF